MFVSHEIELEVTFQAAQDRLVNLADGDGLNNVSRGAYEGELARLTRVGPFGDVAGVSKLVRVRFLDPVYRHDLVSLGLRWEATGVTGGLFPVLDANLTLAAEGEHARLALAGSYRPPFGRVGATLDRVALHQVASGTVRAVLLDIGRALTDPTPPPWSSGPPA